MKFSNHHIWISGEDKRLDFLRYFLEEAGAIVYYEPELAKNEAEKGRKLCDVLISGIPFDEKCQVSCREFLHLNYLLGGLISEQTRHFCEEHHICCYDYMKNIPLAAYNAIATAEGVIAEAIQSSPVNLSESRCLILGYGLCGKQLAKMFHSLGCDVTVSVRNPLLEKEIRDMGLSYLPLNRLPDFLWLNDFIINTIPFPILNESLLRHISPHSLLLDIASSPGGFDSDTACSIGVHFKKLPGLPGKYAPKSSAKAILTCLQKNVPDI